MSDSAADSLYRSDVRVLQHILFGARNAPPPVKEATRRKAEATLVQVRKGADFSRLASELSEDPGSAKHGKSYDVTPTAGLVPPFKNLSLRLKVGEVGVVKSDFGIHSIQRVE